MTYRHLTIRSLARRHANRQHANRRGAVMVLAAVLLFMMLSFLAFTIDTGFLAASKAELRRSADAAAIAGCWELHEGLVKARTPSEMKSTVEAETAAYAGLNSVTNRSPQLINDISQRDTKIGYLANLRSAEVSDDSSLPFHAVNVTVNRTASQNGEIPFFFGRIFGDSGRPMVASATAIMARNISGFATPASANESIEMLPFALDLQTWQSVLNRTASDGLFFDTTTNQVVNGSDGLPEVNLYPQGTGSPGNRGTVDIGGSNNSTADIARQIVSGISANDIAALGKPLRFNQQGTIFLNGDTGISAGVKDELASIIGKPRIIPIFSTVTDNGNNATYTIVKWVGVRVLQVRLTGAMSKKSVIIQPAPIIARNFVMSQSATFTSDFVYSPVLLVQ